MYIYVWYMNIYVWYFVVFMCGILWYFVGKYYTVVYCAII